MIIESIIRVRNKIKVSFDNDTYLFLNEDIILQYGVYRGNKINDSEYENLVREAKLLSAKESAYRYLSLRPHSIFELKTKLKKKEFEDLIINEVVKYLIQQNYLNDVDFAERFVDQKITNGKAGSNKIRQMLFRKGISRDIIDRLLDEKRNEIENEESIEIIALKKYKLLAHKNPEKQKMIQKIFNHLVNKGFSRELSYKAAQKIIENSEEI